MDSKKIDQIVESNVELLRSRSAIGIEKYGTTLADSNLPMRDRLNHALLEALDQANYLQWAIQACDQSEAAPQVTALSQTSRAKKIGGSYQAEGTIVSTFATLAGETRHVFEFDQPAGMLHIFGPGQVEIAAAPQVVADERAYTAEQARDQFMDQVRHLVVHWERESRAPTAKEKLEGLAFSIMNIFDGTSGLPAFDIVCAPHPDDKQYHIDEGSKYFVPGMVINECHLHEMMFSGRAAAPVQAQEPVALICTSCGTDRLKDPCPTTADHCTMAGVAHSAPVQPVAVPDGALPGLPRAEVATDMHMDGKGVAAFTDAQIRVYGHACHALGRGAAVREYVESGTFAAPAAQGDAETLQKVRDAVERFKVEWMKVPYFADRVNKATREQIGTATSIVVNIPCIIDAAIAAKAAS